MTENLSNLIEQRDDLELSGLTDTEISLQNVSISEDSGISKLGESINRSLFDPLSPSQKRAEISRFIEDQKEKLPEISKEMTQIQKIRYFQLVFNSLFTEENIAKQEALTRNRIK